MIVTDKTMKLWFGTPDAPAPKGELAEGADLSITTGVSPVHPDNSVIVNYTINSEEEKKLVAAFLPNLSDPDKQYFGVSLPRLRVNDVVKYQVCFFCSGQRIPAIENANQTETVIHVTGQNNYLGHSTQFREGPQYQRSYSDLDGKFTDIKASKSRKAGLIRSRAASPHRVSRISSSLPRILRKKPITSFTTANHYNAYRIPGSLPKAHSSLERDFEWQLWANNRMNEPEEFTVTLLDGQKISFIREKISRSSKTKNTFWIKGESGRQLSPNDISNDLLPLFDVASLGSATENSTTTTYFPTNSHEPVIICQGKPARDVLTKRGLLALGTLNGTLRTPSQAALRPIAERPVILWPNNSDAGIKHMERIANKLTEMGNKSIKMIAWKGKEHHAYVWQFAGSDNEIREMLINAATWPGHTDLTDFGRVDFGLPATPLRMTVKGDYATESERLVQPSFWKRNRRIQSISKNVEPILNKIQSNLEISQSETVFLNRQLQLLEGIVGRPIADKIIANIKLGENQQ